MSEGFSPDAARVAETEWTAFAVGTGVPELPAILPVRVPGFPPQIVPLPAGLPGAESIRPDYAGNFACIATACEDNCCQGWSVPVDQATYEKYRSHPVMKPFVGTLVVLNTSAPSTNDYARMPLTTSGVCAFLEQDRLCGIQKHLGEGMLSKTCAGYPRASVIYAGEIETALNLSCPEAARVTLLDENLLGDEWPETVGPERYAEVRKNAPRRPEDIAPRLRVREYALLVLTDRSYPVWQRLYLLGLLMRRLQRLCERTGTDSVGAWCDAHPLSVAHTLAESAQTAASGRLVAAMDAMTANPAEQIQLVMAILRMRIERPPVSERFLECVRDVEDGLGCATARCEEEILAAYREAYELYYAPLMDRHPHLLENYLLNHIFKNGYPFGWTPDHAAPGFVPAADAEREHLSLCVHAALVQTMLIGMAARHREAFDGTHVVKLVQSLARAVEHSRAFVDEMLRAASERKLEGAQGIAAMLRVDGLGANRLRMEELHAAD